MTGLLISVVADDDVYVEWVDASGNAHLSPIDPQSFTRLLKRPNPSIRLLKRSGDHAAADEDLDKRAAMVRYDRQYLIVPCQFEA